MFMYTYNKYVNIFMCYKYKCIIYNKYIYVLYIYIYIYIFFHCWQFPFQSKSAFCT